MTDDPPPYRSERAPHGSLPGVYTLNCPSCYPAVSVVWLAADGSVLGRPCLCTDAEILAALHAPTEEERRRVSAPRRGLPDPASAVALDQARAAGYSVGFVHGLAERRRSTVTVGEVRAGAGGPA